MGWAAERCTGRARAAALGQEASVLQGKISGQALAKEEARGPHRPETRGERGESELEEFTRTAKMKPPATEAVYRGMRSSGNKSCAYFPLCASAELVQRPAAPAPHGILDWTGPLA